jgi:hypothetical protein
MYVSCSSSSTAKQGASGGYDYTTDLGQWMLQQRMFIHRGQHTVNVRLLQQVHSYTISFWRL